MKLSLIKKANYGRWYYYPNCPSSDLILKMMRRKTFLEEDLKKMTDIGWQLEMITEGA